MIVSIPRSISFAVRVMTPFEASTIIHSRIDMVVLLETALDTICTPLSRLDFEQTNFYLSNGKDNFYFKSDKKTGFRMKCS